MVVIQTYDCSVYLPTYTSRTKQSMAPNITPPAILNTKSHLWQTMRTDWKFWAFVVFAIVFFFFFLGVLALLPLAVYYGITYMQVRTGFWKQVAKVNGWIYKGRDLDKVISAMMLSLGDYRHVDHVIEGTSDGVPFTTFAYTFHKKGSDNKTTSHSYQVITFDVGGSFPHLYLNNKNNQTSIHAGVRVPLPHEFEKIFSLSSPQQYEQEALEIFTPDILTKILEGSSVMDVEFVEHYMVLFSDAVQFDFREFEIFLKKAFELRSLLASRLNKFTFEKIGDINPTLKATWHTDTV